MTAIPGTQRLVTSRATIQQAMWTWMRRRRVPWSVPHFAEATGASDRQARRYVARLAEAGYLQGHGEEDSGGGFPRPLWLLKHDTGPIAPVLVGGAEGDEVRDANGKTDGASLTRLREQLGMTVVMFGTDVLGVRDPRTVRRYEQAAALPPVIEERIAKYCARHRIHR